MRLSFQTDPFALETDELVRNGQPIVPEGFCWQRFADSRLAQFEYAEQLEQEECLEQMKCTASELEFETALYARSSGI
ncbi:MAG TPA: hypothetical protein VEK08_18110 [Planctomycetota bacterium]|nr:hypothetical protein [Planctomycetota bacterium]